MLEPYEGKLSCTVLRGEGGSNALDLPDIQKQGDFFVESPIILLAAIIWYLRIYKDGKYCTFPHTIEFLNKPYADIFTILTSYPSLENYLSPFMDAWQGFKASPAMVQYWRDDRSYFVRSSRIRKRKMVGGAHKDVMR